jgi:hypothetical protein
MSFNKIIVRMANQFSTFLDGRRGRNISIDEFSYIFYLLAIAGVCGTIFSASWAVALLILHAEFWNTASSILYGLAFCGFFAQIVVSIFSIQFINDVIKNSEEQNLSDLSVRMRVCILLGLFIVSCFIIIFVTGGLASPFIPFYIMVFTLALPRCSIPHPAVTLLRAFVIPFVLACLASYFLLGSIVPPATIKQIKDSHAKDLFDIAFATLSLVVPYYGIKWVESRDKKVPRTLATEQAAQ